MRARPLVLVTLVSLVMAVPSALAADPPVGVGHGGIAAIGLTGAQVSGECDPALPSCPPLAALTVGGNATCKYFCFFGASLLGSARANVAAVAGTGESHGGLVAVSAASDAEGGHLCTTLWPPLFCVTGVAVAGGNATAPAYCLPFTSCIVTGVAVSLFGDASGVVAVSGTGDANGYVAVSGCDAAGVCT